MHSVHYVDTYFNFFVRGQLSEPHRQEGSGSITDKYIDVELSERHNSVKRKRIEPEFIE